MYVNLQLIIWIQKYYFLLSSCQGNAKKQQVFVDYLLLSWTLWCEEKTLSYTSQQETYSSDDSTFHMIDILNVYKFTEEDYFFLKGNAVPFSTM